MTLENISIRFAVLEDLGFVRHSLQGEIAERKINSHEIVVAEENNSLVGYLHLEYLWSKIPYIGLIHVSPDYQRRGVGKALLSYVEEFLRERGYKALYSSSQVDEVEPQTWHRHVGFEECGIINGINEGGIGELFFRKRL